MIAKLTKLTFALAFILSRTSAAVASPTIGPCEGIKYRVIQSQQVTKADPARCGYNDLSLPNTATFTREDREYTECRDGIVVRVYRQTVDVFVRCHNP